jgi:hypothetical protein
MINRVLGWTGCFFVCVGALLTTFDIDPLNIYALNVGAIIYAAWGIRTRQWNQVAVNGFLIAIYGLGLVLRIN